jgi:hypothetical protein
MGFHKSSMNIELKEGHILTAYCARPSGEARYSELDLNDFLGVRKGKQSSITPHLARPLGHLIYPLGVCSLPRGG